VPEKIGNLSTTGMTSGALTFWGGLFLFCCAGIPIPLWQASKMSRPSFFVGWLKPNDYGKNQ